MSARNQMRRRMMGAARPFATFVGISLASSTVLAFPPGTQAGDLAFVSASYGGAAGSTMPAGWARIRFDPVYAASQTQSFFYKVLTAGDISSPPGISAITSAVVLVAVYRGATSVVGVDYKSNPTNVGAVTISSLPAPTAASKGWISVATDRDSSAAAFFPGSEEITGWMVRGHRNGVYPSTLADTCPKWGPKRLNLAWSVVNGSFGEAAWVFELR